MKTIRLGRKNRVLYIGDNSEDIDSFSNITLLYNVTHVLNKGNHFYGIYREGEMLGFITDVENVEERWE